MALRGYVVAGFSAFLFSLPNTGVGAFSPSPISATPSTTTPLHLFGGNKKSDHDNHDNGASVDIVKIENTQDFLDFISDDDDRLAIVKIHATWCKSCQNFGVKYRKLASEEGDKVDRVGRSVERGRVRFAEMEFNANLKLCRSLGIKRLPYIHMYAKGSRIEDFSCAPKKFQMVVDKLNEHVDATPEEIAFKIEMDAGSTLLDGVVADLQLNFLQGKNETLSVEN